MDIKSSEKMVCRASAELFEGTTVFVGIGLPNVACNLARATHAPNLFMIYESGAVGTVPERLPVSIGDPALVTDSLSICGVSEIFQNYLQAGKIDVGFLGGAQIDRWGNLNTTVIGDDYDSPKVRLPGSGGACEIAIHSKKILIVMKLSPRSFVEKCDFITSPGNVIEGVHRSQKGLAGGGPEKVITDLGVLDFDETGEMILTELYEGVEVDEVQSKCSWDLKIASDLKRTKEPSEKEILLLRETLDPKGLYL